MKIVFDNLRFKLPFMIGGFASLVLSVYLYFVADNTTAAIFVGLWVPSIHSLGALMLSADPEHLGTDVHARERVAS